MGKEITLEDEKKAVKSVQKWAGAGKDAYRAVQKIESAKLHGEVAELTNKEKTALVSGALRMFLDGDMSAKSKKFLLDHGLDPTDLRKSIVEATMPQTLAKIVSEGDIERLVALGQLAGEKPEIDVPQGAKRIMRERIIVELDD